MSETLLPIRGKVAKILNSRELILNVGTEHGVQENMMFEVLDPKAQEIKDPDSGEIIGSVDRPKVRVKIIKVEQKLAIATTFRKKTLNVGGAGPELFGASSFAKMLQPPKIVEIYETLKTDEQTWENLDERDSFVKTGDPVVQIIEETKIDEKTVKNS